MRVLRLLIIGGIIAAYAAMPQLGRFVTTANASSATAAGPQASVYGPLNDNEDDDPCANEDPRKQKKCHFNEANGDNDNGATAGVDPSVVYLAVSNANPAEGDPFILTVRAVGENVNEIWWWIPDANTGDDNDNGSSDDSGLTEAHYLNCGSTNDCTINTTVAVQNDGTFTIFAKARDASGRESAEVATPVYVHE